MYLSQRNTDTTPNKASDSTDAVEWMSLALKYSEGVVFLGHPEGKPLI